MAFASNYQIWFDTECEKVQDKLYEEQGIDGAGKTGLIFQTFTTRPLAESAWDLSQSCGKTRLGILYAGALWWERSRAAVLAKAGLAEGPSSSVVPRASFEPVLSDISDLRQEVLSLVSNSMDSLHREIVALRDKEVPVVPPVVVDEVLTTKVADVALNVGLLTSKIQDEQTRRTRLQFERDARETAAKALKAERRTEAEAKAKAVKEEKQAKAKAKAAQKRDAVARRKNIAAAKARGENPYSPDETKAFVAKLEKRGKVYYTPEQRAAYQKANPQSLHQKGKAKAAAARFRNYSDEAKAKYIKKNFTDLGKRYFTPSERKEFKRKQRSRVLPRPAVGPSTSDAPVL